MSTIDLGTLTDDRGTQVPLIAVSAEEFEHAVPSHVRRTLVATLLIVLAIPFILLVAIHWLGLFRGSEALIVFASLVPLIAVGSWYAWFQQPARVRRTIARARLDQGNCAGCLYPLTSLEQSSDAAIVCPECGAAWRMLRP